MAERVRFPWASSEMTWIGKERMTGVVDERFFLGKREIPRARLGVVAPPPPGDRYTWERERAERGVSRRERRENEESAPTIYLIQTRFGRLVSSRRSAHGPYVAWRVQSGAPLSGGLQPRSGKVREKSRASVSSSRLSLGAVCARARPRTIDRRERTADRAWDFSSVPSSPLSGCIASRPRVRVHE